MYKISVIIPIYNAEKTIERAINSVINQTFDFKQIQLILVDDNSSDNSKAIIKRYSDNYDNILAIYLDDNHGGPAIPRNVGIKNANSEYLMFLDNDDAYMNDYCETMYNVIMEENCDVVNCKFASKLLDGVYIPSNTSKKRIIVEDRISLGFPMWINIFKTNFIKENNITCPNTGSEDGNFTIRAYVEANKVVALPKYHGYIHTVESDDNQSLGHSVSMNSLKAQLDGYNVTKQYFEDNGLDKSKLFNDKIRNILFALFNFEGSNKQKLEILDDVYNFEIGLNYPIKLKSTPLNTINNLILNKRFKIVIIILSIANKAYNQRKIKNIFYKNFFGLKKISDA